MRIAPILFLLSSGALAFAQDVQITGEAGWGTIIRPEEWAPVALDVDNLGAENVDVRLCVVWGAPAAAQGGPKPFLESLNGRSGLLHEVHLTLPARSRKRVALSLLAPRDPVISSGAYWRKDWGPAASTWVFAFSAKGKRLAVAELPTWPVDPQKRLVAIVGRAKLAGLDPEDVETAWVQPDRLPHDWRGYRSLDALIWLDGQASEVRAPAQMDALNLWIASGGRLIVARSDDVGIGGTMLMPLLPVKFRGSREVAELGALRELPGIGEPPAGKTVVLETALLRGQVPLSEGETPLVVESRRGVGRVTFVAFDPSASAFATWKGARAFWEWLLGPRRPPGLQARAGPSMVGSPELAGTAAQFPGLVPPAIGGLLALMVLFLLIVSPGDYFILRWLRRPEATWFTFPAYALAFTAVILLIGSTFMRSVVVQRDIAVVDYYGDANACRTRVLGAVLAPERMAVEFEEGLPIASNFLSALRSGLTEGEEPEAESTRIVHDTSRKVADWVLERGATGLVAVDACSTKPPPLIFAIEETDGTEAKVSLRNESGIEYDEAVVVTPHGVFRIGAIPTGATALRAPRVFETPDQHIQALRNAAATPGDARPEKDAERLLVRMSFIEEGAAGMARDLFAGGWVDAGGSILLAFPRRPEAQIAFRPAPKILTSVVLVRVFQGAPR